MADETKKQRPREAAMDPHKLGRHYVQKRATAPDRHATLRFYRGEWWRWQGGRYRQVDREQLMAEVTSVVKQHVDDVPLLDRYGDANRVTRALIGNVLNALRGQLLVNQEVELPVMLDGAPTGEYLAFANGLLNVAEADSMTTTLRPLTAAYFSPVVFPYAYEPESEAPRWFAFLEEVLEGDRERIRLLQEWFGLMLLPDTSFHKFLVLEGEGANGKSVVLEILGAMLGEENVTHVPLGLFGERFQLTPTLGKLANIAPESDESERPNLGTLKQFTAGDRMYFDRKGISGIQAKPTARLVIATNNRPPFGDRSSGLWRRMLLVPFRVTIPPDKQDRELAVKLRGELPGILNWSLAGLKRLRAKGRFTDSKVATEALAEYRLESNPAEVFLTDFTEARHGARVGVDELFQGYRHYCKANGYVALNAQQFGKEVKKRYRDARRTRPVLEGRRSYMHEGIGLTQQVAVAFDTSAAALAA